MADITKTQLASALETSEHTQRHQQQPVQPIRDPETAPLELNTSRSYPDNSREQLKASDVQNKGLIGPLHPIRHCPHDILVLIFEWTLEIDERYQLIIANTLSQVCKSWRIVALNTASLWSHFRISTSDGIPDVTLAMERIKAPMRNLPPEIELHMIDEWDPQKMEQIMGQVQLRRFNSIKSLTYRLRESDSLKNLAHPSLLFSPASVDHVAVNALSESDDPQDWDCVCILEQSPDISSLELEVHNTIIFGGDQVYPALLKLFIRNSPVPSLLLQLNKFPGIQELRIDGQLFNMQPISEDIVLPQLRMLHIEDVVDFDWSRISAPRLRELLDNNSNWDHRVLAFCLRHPSILEFTYSTWIKEEQLKALANSMSNLENLDAGGDVRGLYLNVVPEMPFPPFPKLKVLTVDDTGDQRLSLVEFESFVRTRLLPQHSQEKPTLKVLKIIVRIEEMDILPWRKSDLFSRLHESHQKCDYVPSMRYVTLTAK